MKAIEAIAAAADRLAVRAQPQTVASRLTLRDFKDAVAGLSGAAHALGDGIEDRLAVVLPAGAWSPIRQAGARVNFAAGYLDEANSAMTRDLHALHQQDPGNLDERVTGGRRLLVRASSRFAEVCEVLRSGPDLRAMPEVEQETSIALLWGTCVHFGSAVNHVALLTDNACERALGRTSGALTPLMAARRELEKARQRMDVLKAVFQG